MNVVILKGNITADPTNRKTETGKTVSNITIACQMAKDSTVFVRCTAWEKTAEAIIKYFKKGNPILVNGELRTAKDKEGHEQLYVNINNFDFCSGKKADDKPLDDSFIG